MVEEETIVWQKRNELDKKPLAIPLYKSMANFLINLSVEELDPNLASYKKNFYNKYRVYKWENSKELTLDYVLETIKNINEWKKSTTQEYYDTVLQRTIPAWLKLENYPGHNIIDKVIKEINAAQNQPQEIKDTLIKRLNAIRVVDTFASNN